jgi:hypothetical protein
MNVQMRERVLRTFITRLLVHIHQKTKIAPKIAAKIASVNGPLRRYYIRWDNPHTQHAILHSTSLDCTITSPQTGCSRGDFFPAFPKCGNTACFIVN